MNVLVIIFLAIVGAALAVTAAVYLVVPVFKGIGYGFRGIGWLIAHLFRFVFGMIGDVLRAIGALVTSIVFVPLVVLNVLIGRWSASAHFGRALQQELTTAAHCGYRVLIGHPARLLLLDSLTEGIEKRVPEALARAPGSDKPSKKTGAFAGYKIVGSLRGGGSGGKLYVAEPLGEKKAAFVRAGLGDVGQVVIKSFSIQDGSSLPQIIRESRALEAARKLQLVLDHELTNERFFYVMPYVPGEDLSDRTLALHSASSAEGLSLSLLREGVGYVVDLLHTLDRYHSGGLWHKDIKPDNIIVHEGKAHLVDLGLVTPLRSAMTLTTHGTEYFRDPELVRLALRGVKVHEVDGVKFDIYGAGAVLFSVIENSFPAHGGLSQITKRCPDALRWVIRRAMTDLNQRYPSARHMLADLVTIAQADDPYALKPANLPSMMGADLSDIEPATDEPVLEPLAAAVGVGAGVGAGAAPGAASAVGGVAMPAAHTPVPQAQPGARRGRRAPFAAPVRAERPRIKVLDWWTGRYAVENARAVETVRMGAAGSPRGRQNPVMPVDGRSAREQLESARARVQAARTRARRRPHVGVRVGSPRYSNAPNFGVAIAVVVMLGLVLIGAMIVAKLGGSRMNVAGDAGGREPAPTLGLHEVDPDGNGRTVHLIVDDGAFKRRVHIGPRNNWDKGLREVAVAVTTVGSRKAEIATNGLSGEMVADDLFGAGKDEPRLLFVDYTPVGDPNSPRAEHFAWLQESLAQIDAEVLGFGSGEAEIEAIAQAQHAIGTALPGDARAIADLRAWMSGAEPRIDGVFWVAPEEDWQFITAEPGGIERLYEELDLEAPQRSFEEEATAVAS